MLVRVLFFGPLKDLAGHAEERLEVPEGASLGSVFADCWRRLQPSGDGTASLSPASILFARNREFARAETLLSDGDEIAFLPPVSGGSTNDSVAGPHVLLVREPLNVLDLSRYVARSGDGAVVTFEGIVRDNSKGRPTRYLEYEAYEPMAVARMAQLASQIAQQFAVDRVAVAHRLGRLEIGEASVAIAVSAPHRRPAFEAALSMIDRLKREVPIWKKEYFNDGEVWVDGAWDDQLVTSV